MARPLRTLQAILVVAVVVSVVHYTDNFVNFDDYPPPRSLPDPGAASIPIAWVLFTGAGLAGYLLFRRAISTPALVLLAVYSGSGLIGIGHYLVPGAFDMPWWRQLHVGLDIACGVAVLAFVAWTTRHRVAAERAREDSNL